MLSALLKKLLTDDGNFRRYRLIYGSCFVIHAFYAVLFGIVNVPELMLFNIFSTVMYISGLIIVRNNMGTIVWMLLLNLEIMIHGILCADLLGYQYQFSLFTLAVIPITYFITYVDPAFTHPITFSTIMAAVNGASVMISLFGSAHRTPRYHEMLTEFSHIIAQVNMITTILLLIMFSVVFTGKISADMKMLREQNDRLDYLANYDQLTGLRNRNHIRDIFNEYIQSDVPYSVILGDIDDFKLVNDTYGHNAGDSVLKTVSAIISGNVGDRGVVCRWGGEEILILVKGDTVEGLSVIGKILDEIRSAEVTADGRNISVTMTFGLCGCREDANIEKLISLADKRLYIGKKNGKNRVVANG